MSETSTNFLFVDDPPETQQRERFRRFLRYLFTSRDIVPHALVIASSRRLHFVPVRLLLKANRRPMSDVQLGQNPAPRPVHPSATGTRCERCSSCTRPDSSPSGSPC
jgi:hypothetical protein